MFGFPAFEAAVWMVEIAVEMAFSMLVLAWPKTLVSSGFDCAMYAASAAL
jgi:hypothetical protein